MKTKRFALKYARENCDELARINGTPYGIFSDTSGNFRTERINPTALYAYHYRTDAPPAPDPVKVLFRVWPASKGGEVLALFPEIPGTIDPAHCQSYAHTGQHSSADPQGCIAATRRATMAEAAPLIRELESAPFHYSLRIIARTPADAYATRRAAIAESRKPRTT